MDYQIVSQIAFEYTYNVPSHQTARELYSTLSVSKDFARILTEGFATAYVVAVMEAICMRALTEHINSHEETIVGTSVKIMHTAPTPAGSIIKLRGWVEAIDAKFVTFFVRANDQAGLIGEAEITFAIVSQQTMRARLSQRVKSQL